MYLQLVSLLLDIGHARHSWFWGVCVCVCVCVCFEVLSFDGIRVKTFFYISCEIIHYNV